MSPPPQSPPSLRVWPISQVQPEPLSWLWQLRLALGKLALLQGDPGLGKSLITLDLCARLSRGLPFPDGSPSPGAANALVFNAEDNVADTIWPRLQGLGADPERVFVPRRDGREREAHFRLPSGADALDKVLAETRPRLLVFDPVLAFLDPAINPNSDRSVRRALEPLVDLAEKYACAPFLVLHLNKKPGRRSAYRGLGSIAFPAVCRSVWHLDHDPEDPARCVLAQVKNNLGPPQLSLAYSVPFAEGKPVTVTWHGPSPWTAEQLVGAAPPAAPQRPRAREFLAAFLEAGPRTSADIWAAAREQRLTRRTLDRAKRDLKLRSARVWADGQRLSYWLLPHQELPAAVAADSDSDLEPWLKPVRDKYGDSDPLADL